MFTYNRSLTPSAGPSIACKDFGGTEKLGLLITRGVLINKLQRSHLSSKDQRHIVNSLASIKLARTSVLCFQKIECVLCTEDSSTVNSFAATLLNALESTVRWITTTVWSLLPFGLRGAVIRIAEDTLLLQDQGPLVHHLQRVDGRQVLCNQNRQLSVSLAIRPPREQVCNDRPAFKSPQH